MSVSRKHCFGAIALLGALALLTTGCQWRPVGRLPRLLDLSSADQQPNASNASTAFAAEDLAVLARHSDEDQQSLWIRTIRSDEDSKPPTNRWRYPALEELLARPAEKRPDLHRCLHDRSSTVVANAAIALARLGDDSGTEQLADAVRTTAFPSPMRCAAAEALANLPGPAALQLTRELVDQYGKSGTGYRSELHEELILGLTRHGELADKKYLAAALKSPSPNVLVAALEAFSGGPYETLPPEAVKLTAHTDVRVRQAALRALAKRKHPEALARLRAALNDHDVRVRIAAVAALGQLGGSEAQEILQDLLQSSPHERIRAEAATALGLVGAKRPVLEAIDDQSWQVRQYVARALARFPDREATAAAEKLLDDPSVKVQSEVVAALKGWPLSLAGPLLIETLDSRCLTTRRAAIEQLATRWPEASDLDASMTQRISDDRLEELRNAFRQQFGGIDPEALSQALGPQRSEPSISSAEVDRIEQIVLRGEVGQLAELGPELVEALERIVFDRKRALPEAIYRQVLPRYGPEFIALDQMDSPDRQQRRRATSTLVGLADEKPLGRLAAARLYQLVCNDSDQLLWQNALRAAERNPHEPAIRLAYAAASHPSPEVRRRACDNLAACPQPQHAQVLLATLEDTSDSVVCAAVHALAALGRIDDTGPLRKLMTDTNENVRVETAIALARLGDEKGTSALERLAHSNDPKIQYRVVTAMGEMPDPAFVPILIRLLDAKMTVSRGALRSLPKVVGRDVAAEQGRASATTTQRIQHWKRWYYRQASAGTQNGVQSF